MVKNSPLLWNTVFSAIFYEFRGTMQGIEKKGAGMSRAAQNKRKKLNKVQGLILAPSLNNKQSDSDDSEQESSKPLKKIKKTHNDKPAHGASSDILTKYDGFNEDIDLSEISLTNILDMKEIVEVTSKDRASILLAKIISPTSLPEFYTSTWEKRPLFVEHNSKSYFADLINFDNASNPSNIDAILKEQLFIEGDDMSFSNEEGMLDVKGQVIDNEDEIDENKQPVQISYSQIQKRLAASHTVNFLSPQKYHDGLWRLLSAMEHEFDCMVGANVIIAPPNSVSNEKQYDNRDNFILQVKGSSEWSLWPPSKGNELPRSSGTAATDAANNEAENVDKDKKEDPPTHKHTLKTGDTLYIPKGWMYQQSNIKDNKSYSIKIFTNQSNSYADLMELLLPQAIHEAAQSNIAFRKCLPRNFSSFQGVLVQEDESLEPKRSAVQNHMKTLLDKMVEVALDVLDPAADQLTKKFMGERLPVPTTDEEDQYSSSECTIHPYTKLRMIRPGIASVFVEDGKCVVYHCMGNSREVYGNALQPLEFDIDDGPTIEELLRSYPEGVTVSELFHPNEELDDKLGVAQALFKEGFLMIVDEASRPTVSQSKNSGDEGSNDEDDDDDSIF